MAAPKKPAAAPAKPAPAPAPAPAPEEEEEAGAGVEAGSGFTVDLTDVPEQGNFEAMPRGIYACTVSNLTFGQSQSSGNNMWSVELEVDGEQHPDYANRKLFTHLVFTEGGVPRVKKALARMQTDDGFPQTLLQGAFDPEVVANEGRLIGARCKARVDVKMYEGEKRNNVRDILPPDGAGGDFATT
jgi:hypothetical protein